MRTALLSGKLPAKLGNDVSDAIHHALKRGLAPDEAVCIVIAVAADYARGYYGDEYLSDLTKIIEAKRGTPLPNMV